MSEELVDTGVAAPAVDAPAPAVADAAGDSPLPAAENTDVFGGSSFEAQFGLEAADGPAPAPTSDAPVVADPPVLRQDTVVTDPPTTTAPAEVQPVVDDLGQTDKKPAFEFNDKLNWDDENAPKQFREEFKGLKQAFLDIASSSMETQLVTDPQGFAKRMEEISPTSFNEIGTHIATEAAKANPQGWVDYFVKNNPDLVTEMLTGREGMTQERLKAELEVLLDEDDPDVKAALERNKGEAQPTPAAETPEQKEVREWREERAFNQRVAITREVFQPIESAVDTLVADAGLEVDLDAYKGQDFASLDEDTQFKVMVNEFIPVWIDMRVQQDPRLVNMQARLEAFLQKGDKQSAMALQHHAKIAATNFAGEALSIFTGKRAALKGQETKAPALDSPKPHVRTTGAPQGELAPTALPAADDENPWKVTEADMFKAGAAGKG